MFLAGEKTTDLTPDGCSVGFFVCLFLSEQKLN